jgi:hypothetical protein
MPASRRLVVFWRPTMTACRRPSRRGQIRTRAGCCPSCGRLRRLASTAQWTYEPSIMSYLDWRSASTCRTVSRLRPASELPGRKLATIHVAPERRPEAPKIATSRTSAPTAVRCSSASMTSSSSSRGMFILSMFSLDSLCPCVAAWLIVSLADMPRSARARDGSKAMNFALGTAPAVHPTHNLATVRRGYKGFRSGDSGEPARPTRRRHRDAFAPRRRLLSELKLKPI